MVRLWQAADRQKLLMKYVCDVQPAVMEQFAQQGPVAVVAAMRSTITNMLGTLPPQFFTVTISTVGENLAQLMFSVMMTGYMFRNAQYRLELRNTLGPLASSSINASLAASAATAAVASSISSSAKSCNAEQAQRAQSAPASTSLSLLDEETYAPGVQKSRVQVSTWLVWCCCSMPSIRGRFFGSVCLGPGLVQVGGTKSCPLCLV